MIIANLVARYHVISHKSLLVADGRHWLLITMAAKSSRLGVQFEPTWPLHYRPRAPPCTTPAKLPGTALFHPACSARCPPSPSTHRDSQDPKRGPPCSRWASSSTTCHLSSQPAQLMRPLSGLGGEMTRVHQSPGSRRGFWPSVVHLILN